MPAITLGIRQPIPLSPNTTIESGHQELAQRGMLGVRVKPGDAAGIVGACGHRPPEERPRRMDVVRLVEDEATVGQVEPRDPREKAATSSSGSAVAGSRRAPVSAA